MCSNPGKRFHQEKGQPCLYGQHSYPSRVRIILNRKVINKKTMIYSFIWQKNNAMLSGFTQRCFHACLIWILTCNISSDDESLAIVSNYVHIFASTKINSRWKLSNFYPVVFVQSFSSRKWTRTNLISSKSSFQFSSFNLLIIQYLLIIFIILLKSNIL